ncbi:hypothetical protein CF326_g7237 [Tilletia indica]|nr:hypothetical protein CF326_g7237 [Tilletia indica]
MSLALRTSPGQRKLAGTRVMSRRMLFASRRLRSDDGVDGQGGQDDGIDGQDDGLAGRQDDWQDGQDDVDGLDGQDDVDEQGDRMMDLELAYLNAR